MGLDLGDLDKVPAKTSPEECYTLIYDWHRKRGAIVIKEIYGREDEYSTAYLLLLKLLPAPNEATPEDMDFVFCEVISMLMEWSYHKADERGIKMAAYAHFALNKRYPSGFADRQLRQSVQQSRLFSAPVSNLLLVLSEGRLKVIPASQQDAQKLLTPAGIYLPTVPYVIVPRALSLLRQQLDQFENLLNDPETSEAQIQEFFEKHPDLLKGVDYEKVLPHPVLERSEGTRLIPDFFLQPVGRQYADILDLKLPTEKLIAGSKNRLRLAGSVQEAVAQVREYRDYFEDPGRRASVATRYGLTAYRPNVAVIIGRTPQNLGEEKLRQIQEGLPGYVKVMTYDELFRRMERVIQVFDQSQHGL